MHASHPLPVLTTARVRLDTGISYLVPVTFHYTPSDPLAITMSIAVEGAAPVRWRLCRSLLHDGVGRSMGEGDVRVSPGGAGEVLLRLSGTHATATFALPTGPLLRCLRASFAAVPPGSEGDTMDWDAALRHLTAPSSAPFED